MDLCAYLPVSEYDALQGCSFRVTLCMASGDLTVKADAARFHWRQDGHLLVIQFANSVDNSLRLLPFSPLVLDLLTPPEGSTGNGVKT